MFRSPFPGADAALFEEKFEEMQKRVQKFDDDVAAVSRVCDGYMRLDAMDDRAPLPTLVSRQTGSTAIRLT